MAKKEKAEAVGADVDVVVAPEETVDAAPEVAAPADNGRQARWDAWLDNARSQRPENKDEYGVSPRDVFDAQRARGEFNNIPDWLQ
jgi:hypothetical protein